MEGGDDVPQQQRRVVRLERVELAEGAREVVERLLRPADPLVLDAGVEEREGVVRLARDLLHHDRHVAVGLLLRPAGRLEVAVVVDLDPDEARAAAALRVDGAHDLLVQGAAVPVGGPVAEDAERRVDDRLDPALLADEVDLAQAVPLHRLVVEQVAHLRAVHELLVGVEHQDPVAGGGVDRGVAGRGEVAPPLLVQHARPERLRDLDGAVDGARVDDDQLVAGLAHAGEAVGEHLLLVAHDHAEGELSVGGELRVES